MYMDRIRMLLPNLSCALIFLLTLEQTSCVVGKYCRLKIQQPVQGAVGTYEPPSTSLPPFKYGSTPVRGVNLGGWFVLEPWITPSIFQQTNNDAIVDEYTFGQMQDPPQALGILQNHWETWITEDDFGAISAAGLNHVRIPLGYWSVPITGSDTSYSTDTSPYIQGAWPYLLRSLQWARNNNIYVILDLHGAPGSQNGYDNSGQRMADPQWATSANNIGRTLDIIRFVARETSGLISIIELLNEAAGFSGGQFDVALKQYWQDGYQTVRQTTGKTPNVMIGDAFLGLDYWSGFLKPPGATGVLMDLHAYQVFSDDQLRRSWDDHIQFACNNLSAQLTSYASKNLWTIVGEWSAAVTDCALWLNGRGRGPRWENDMIGSCQNLTGSYTTFSDSYKAFLKQYWQAQAEAAEMVQGWIFWTWKAENSDEWSYQKGLAGGWIPSNAAHKILPQICS